MAKLLPILLILLSLIPSALARSRGYVHSCQYSNYDPQCLQESWVWIYRCRAHNRINMFRNIRDMPDVRSRRSGRTSTKWKEQQSVSGVHSLETIYWVCMTEDTTATYGKRLFFCFFTILKIKEQSWYQIRIRAQQSNATQHQRYFDRGWGGRTGRLPSTASIEFPAATIAAAGRLPCDWMDNRRPD